MKQLTKVLVVLSAITVANQTYAAELIVNSFTQVGSESTDQTDTLQLRKLITPSGGFKKGTFKWDSAKDSWTLQGALKQDDRYYGSVRLWKKYYGPGGSLSEEGFDLDAGGIDVTGVVFKAPNGLVYDSLCVSEGSHYGVNTFECEKNFSPGQQTEFKDGRYSVTFKLKSGAQVSRDYYLGGQYPTQFKITSPSSGIANVPLTPTIKWTAVGAAGYDIIIRDINGSTVYSTYVINQIETFLSHTVPAGFLAPNSDYSVTIEPNGPVVNGGSKGVKKRVEFKTAP